MKRRSWIQSLLSIAFATTILNAADVTYANNVTARVSGGSLCVYGDKHNNDVEIRSETPGSVVISSPSATTKVNGKDVEQVLQGWTGGIYFYGYDGADEVSIAATSIRGFTHVDLGQGDDTLFLFTPAMDELLTIKHGLTVIGGGGDDYIDIEDVDVSGATTFNLGAGDDKLFIYSVMNYNNFGGNVLTLPGDGDDLVTCFTFNCERDFTLDSPQGSCEVTIEEASFEQNAFVFTSSGDDLIQINTVEVEGLMKLMSRGGADALVIQMAAIARLETFLGAGDDYLYLANASIENARNYLEGGNDHFYAGDSYFGAHFVYAGAGDDTMSLLFLSGEQTTVYGDGGNDFLSTFETDEIDTIRVYSVENWSK